MKTRVKKMWLKALESGKYKKTRNTLRSPRGFCCLGVLTDLYIKDTGKGKWGEKDVDGNIMFVAPNGELESATLPICVQEWAGLTQENPTVEAGRDKYEQELAHLNDTMKWPFKKIAAAIRANKL